MAELTTAEKAAYQASFKKAKKQQARDKGAADAGGDPIVEAARQRALAPQQPASVSPNPPVGRVQPKPSGRFVQRPDGSRVPEEFYNLNPEQQQQFNQLLKEEENNAAGESQFDRVSLALLDQQAAQAKRVTKLERLVESLVGENMELRRRQDGIDLSVETTKSAALVEQESAIAQQVTNLAAVKAEAESAATTIRRETEIQRLDHDARLAAIEQPLAELEGRVKSSTTLMAERGNAVVDQLASMEGQQSRLGVQLTELEGRTDAIGNPITRAEVKDMVTSTVASEFPAQLPAMVSKELAIQRASGELGEGIEIDRGYLAQSLENSDERSKRFEISEQQIEESKFTNPTQAAVARALKKRRD